MRLAVVGNATRDVIRAGILSERRPGGTLLYATLALRGMGHDVVPVGNAPMRAHAWLRRSGVDVSRVRVAVPGTQFLNRYDGDAREQWARRGPEHAVGRDEDLSGFDGVLLGPVLGEVPAWVPVPGGVPVVLDVQGSVRRLGERNVWGWRRVEVSSRDVRFPRATHVHASIDEAATLTGARDPQACVEGLRERTGAIAVVTMGARGAVTAGTQRHRCRPTPLDVADPTGAGDVFDAGFLHGLVSGEPLEQCLAWGCAAAVAFLSKAWTRRPLDRFGSLDEVRVQLADLELGPG